MSNTFQVNVEIQKKFWYFMQAAPLSPLEYTNPVILLFNPSIFNLWKSYMG